jgi:hypothetical protein
MINAALFEEEANSLHPGILKTPPSKLSPTNSTGKSSLLGKMKSPLL